MGPHEPLGIYLAVMDNLFNRLTIKVSDASRLKILLNNITPFYQTQLALTDIQSVDHLLDLEQRLEARKASVELFKPPPSRRSDRLLEPDLAYIYHEAQTSRNSVDEVQGQPRGIKCYNCNSVGHKAAQCSKPPRRRCYKCNRPNYTVKTCLTCNGSSGDGNRRQ